jgi:hypothetical protein
MVWCPVTTNTTWFARRNGKTFFTGNSGFQVEGEFASKHVIPLGQLIADFLTRNYLWPMLEKRIKDGHSTKQVGDIRHWRLIFDPSNIVARVDMATQALKLHDRGLLSERAVLATCGFELKDARTADERRQALIMDLIKTSPVTLAPVLLPLIDGLEHVVDYLPEPGEDGIVRNQRAGESGNENVERKPMRETNTDRKAPGKRTPEANPKGVPPVEGQDKVKLPGHPGEDTRNPTTSRVSIMESEEFATLVTSVTALAHSAKNRAVEKAGSRLVNLSKKNNDLKDKFSQMSKMEIVKTIDKDELYALETSHDALMVDVLSELHADIEAVFRAWVEEHLIGLSDVEVDGLVSQISREYTQAIIDFTIQTISLADHRFDNGLTVPANIALQILSTYIDDALL